jgi:hypothetical protein
MDINKSGKIKTYKRTSKQQPKKKTKQMIKIETNEIS